MPTVISRWRGSTEEEQTGRASLVCDAAARARPADNGLSHQAVEERKPPLVTGNRSQSAILFLPWLERMRAEVWPWRKRRR